MLRRSFREVVNTRAPIADGALQQRSPDAVGVAVATGDLTRADAGSIGKSIETYVKSRDGVRDG